MQLVSFVHKGINRVGVRSNATEVIAIGASSGADTATPPTMIDLIVDGPDAAVRALVNADRSIAQPIPIDELSWLPPVPMPGKIVGVAMNNSASNERKISAPDHPAFFLKPSSCLIGHKTAIQIRSYYGSVHPEPELAVIIGSITRDVDVDDAMDRVFGYTIFNDITSNGMRAEDLFHYWALYSDDSDPEHLNRREQHLSYAARYKGTDTFGCMGPWLVTANDVPDPNNLSVQCSVGDELIAEDSTRYYNYKIAEIISYLSQFQTLMPGDIISCGTAFKASPGGKTIHQANLQEVAGPVSVSIDGLGTLINTVLVDDKPIGQWRLPAQQESDQDS